MQGVNGPIQLTTDEVTIDSQGNITTEDGLQYFGRLQVVDFADYTQLTKITGGVFEGGGAQQASNATIHQKYTEYSNVNMAEQMTRMMSGQRVLQGSAQILKIYDQLVGKIVTIGSAT